MTQLSQHLEALLFLSGEPISVGSLAKILQKKESEVREALIGLEKILEDRGIRLLRKGNHVMFGTSPESSEYCEALTKEELNKNLNQSGLETLAIILYKGRVVKADIDYIRGVNSASTLRNLLIKGLIERQSNPKDKRTFIYMPTMQLFQYLGINKKEDLPEFENFIDQIKNAPKLS